MKISALPGIYKIKSKTPIRISVSEFLRNKDRFHLYISTGNIINLLFLSLCILIHRISTSILMGDIGNDDIRLFNHPSVSMYNGIFTRNFFQLGINNFIKAIFFILHILCIQIRSDQYQFRISALFLKLLGTTICKSVKIAIASKKKLYRNMPCLFH